MSNIDIEAMLSEISSHCPCGDDLGYDPAFMALENELKGTPEVQYGDTIAQKAQGPNWERIQHSAMDLFSRSHDLRLAMVLVRALVHTAGWPGFRDGVMLVDELIHRYWESLHPLIEAQDHNDPTERLNILESLCDWETMIGPLLRAPICISPKVGTITLRDVYIANGKLNVTDEEENAAMGIDAIEAAFADSDETALQALHTAVNESQRVIDKIVSNLIAKVGRSPQDGVQTPPEIDYSPLQDLLKALNRFFARQIQRYVTINTDDVPEDRPNVSPRPDGHNAYPLQPRGKPMDKAMHSIFTREDIIRSLDHICAYYKKHEPASPVPLLLRRAKGLVEKDFFAIMEDLAPDSIQQIQLISGVSRGSS